jgi:hypothetical protein
MWHVIVTLHYNASLLMRLVAVFEVARFGENLNDVSLHGQLRFCLLPSPYYFPALKSRPFRV